MTFGDKLREARLQKGLTQEQLAQQIGVAKSTLTGYEKGNREPDVFKIKRILEILEVDSDYLLGVSREPEQQEATEYGPEGYTLLNSESKKIVDTLVVQLLELQDQNHKKEME